MFQFTFSCAFCDLHHSQCWLRLSLITPNPPSTLLACGKLVLLSQRSLCGWLAILKTLCLQFGLFVLYPLAFPWLFSTLLSQRRKRLGPAKPKIT